MRDPEQVARAQHAAARLESAWERWRSLQGMADTPAQPVVGYVGYALKEPWGQPRAVIGFSADEAERLAEFLEHGNAGAQQAPLVPAYMAAQPVKQSSASGPQPTFTPQPAFTSQTPVQPAAPPPAAPPPAVPPPAVPPPAVPPPAVPQPAVPQPAEAPAASTRQSGQRSPSRHARGGQPHLSKSARSREQAPRVAESGNGDGDGDGPGKAPDVAAEPGAVAKAPEPRRAATEPAPLVDSGAERSLRASYPVPRVASASYQEPVQHWNDRGRSS
jgi:hypothetical protein